MRDPDEFDAFYRDAGERLLLQTYALTGDLTAARGAVRDSFIVAWHHWRKVSRLDDPEAFVRPRAWRHALRRHAARLGLRDKSIGPEVRATLDALAKLSVTQRKTLLLSQLASVTMPELAREVGLPLEDAERELQNAASQFALALEISAADIPQQLEPLAQVVAEVRFPRAPIVRRAGAARRRTHTTVGVVAAVGAFLLTGSLITDATGVRPNLDFEQVTAADPQRTIDPAPEMALTEDTLLSADQVTATLPGRTWAVRRTGDNSEGSGLLTSCQTDRYADPRGTAALVRTFAAAPGKKRPMATVLQLTEASASPRAARTSYGTALGWYSACGTERVQLLSTRRVDGAGDQAMLLVLRAWAEPVTTMTVGIARTGQYVTTAMSVVRDDQKPDTRAAARLLGEAVTRLCTLPDAGACSAPRPQLTAVPPLPTGKAPAMLAEIDLPPVTGVDKPWIGTPPERATVNPAATRCDGAEFAGKFDGKTFSNNRTRTFVIPKAGLPDTFGLTETVGSLPEKRAVAFVERIRDRLAGCAEKDLGTDVTRVAHRDTKNVDLTVWQLTTEISDEKSVSYTMAVLRDGTSVAQVGFVPSEGARLADGAFVDLVLRALDRLGRLPAPARS